MPAFDAVHGVVLVRGLRFLRAGERFSFDVGKKLPEIAWPIALGNDKLQISFVGDIKEIVLQKKLIGGRRLELFFYFTD